MPLGIELVFSRNFVCKFTENSHFGETDVVPNDGVKHVPVDDMEIEREFEYLHKQWQMFGQFDTLKIQPINSLAEVGNSIDRVPETISISAHSGLVLIPFEDELQQQDQTEFESFVQSVVTQSDPNDTKVVFTDQQSERWQKFPMLAGAKFSLSVIAYELEVLYTGVLHATEALRKIVMKMIQADRNGPKELPQQIRLFRTLSNPDMVLLALPQNTTELYALDQLLQKIRRLGLHELLEELTKRRNKALSRLIVRNEVDWVFQEQEYPIKGHALASVEEFLAFRVVPGKEFCFPAGPPEIELRLDFELWIDCGHDLDVKQQLKEVLLKIAPHVLDGISEKRKSSLDRHLLGKHTISGSLDNFDQFVAVWGQVWKTYSYRAANLIDSHTTVSFADRSHDPEPHTIEPDNHTKHIAWTLAQEVRKDMHQIVTNLTSWANRYLSETQSQEFLNSVGIFRGCFLHHELASAARDLVPFLRQLSFACSPAYQKYWDDFRKFSIPEAFTDEVSSLIVHLHRAVRNRLEHRSGHADPTLPHTLEHGASKLIGAYTAVSWFCSEIFSRRQLRDGEVRDSNNDPCKALNLAVCVAAGNQGRVNFTILFGDFWQFVERKLRFNAEHRPDDELSKWSARLLLLEISGKSLFRPEACLLHCLQETAQYSVWLSSERTWLLRQRLNTWILLEYRDILLKLLDGPDQNDLLEQEMGEFLMYLVPYAVERAVGDYQKANQDAAAERTGGVFRPRPLDNEPTVADFMTAVNQLNPLDFANLVAEAIFSYLPSIDVWREAANFKLKISAVKSKEPKFENIERLPFQTNRLITILSNGGVDPSRQKPLFTELATNLIDLVIEVSSDIGMWCALDHIISNDSMTPDLKHARNSLDRLIDVHLIFSSIIESAGERVGEFLTRTEAEFLLLRWVIQAVAVSDEKTGCDSIIEWIRQPNHRPIVDVFLTQGAEFRDLDELCSCIASRTKTYVTIFGTSLPSARWNQPEDCLITALKLPILESGQIIHIEYYTDQSSRNRQESMGNLGFPFFADLGPAEQLLWSSFQETWKLVRKEADLHRQAADALKQVQTSASLDINSQLQENTRLLAASQVKLVIEMWAKSVRLRYRKAFHLTPDKTPIKIPENAVGI